MIFFQIKVFGKTIKETTLAKHFIKVTARPTFTRLRVIRQIKIIHQIPKWKICCKDSVVSPSYLNILAHGKSTLVNKTQVLTKSMNMGILVVTQRKNTVISPNFLVWKFWG